MFHFYGQKLGPYEVKFMRLYLQHARIYASLHTLHGPGEAIKATYRGMKQVEDGQSSIFAFKGRSIFTLEAMVCKTRPFSQTMIIIFNSRQAQVNDIVIWRKSAIP